MPARKAHARWEGTIKEGTGTLDFGNRAFKGAYSFGSRFEQGPGTNPEELLGAAHAGCFAMSLSLILGEAGFTPHYIDATAHVTIEPQGGGFKITESHIVCKASVQNIDQATLAQHAEAAKANCPVSQALAGTEITLEATPADEDGEGKAPKDGAMAPRIDYAKTAPEVGAGMMGLEQYVHQTGLDRGLLELVKLRASLINGCAYCADMHTTVARSRGETEQRLYAISLWRETPFYSERERAALAWTAAVTRVSVDQVPDDVYDLARQRFTEKELIDLTLAIVAINGWNRLAIAFRTVPGTFQLRVRASMGDAVGVADVEAGR